MISNYDAAIIAVRRMLEEYNVEVYEVLDSDNPRIEDLPISWEHQVGGPKLPPKDCWYVLLNADLSAEEFKAGCGGDVRVICVSKETGEIIYDDEYSEE